MLKCKYIIIDVAFPPNNLFQYALAIFYRG